MQNRSCESEFYLHETENTFPYQEGDKGKGGGGGEGVLVTSSRTTMLRFTNHETNSVFNLDHVFG